MICDNLTVSNGRLLFAGQDTVELARQYGTPLYLMDEDRIRANCRVYTEAFRRHFGPGARPLYASKANSFQRIYEIMREEGMGIDVVSSGEIYTALRAGYDLGQPTFTATTRPMRTSATVWITVSAILWRITWRRSRPLRRRPPGGALSSGCCSA